MIGLQASLLCNFSPFSYNHLPPLHLRHFRFSPSGSLPSFFVSAKSNSKRCRFLLSSTLLPDNVDSKDDKFSVLPEFDQSSVDNVSDKSEVSAADDKIEEKNLEMEGSRSRLPIVAFLIGCYTTINTNLKIMLSKWHKKRLAHLISEADADPTNAIKQTVLLAELNKHNPEAVVKRFEKRDHVVDCRGVAEYIKALVATNAIAEYLPDEQSGNLRVFLRCCKN